MKLFIALASVTIILYGMKYAEGVLGPILLALFMTMGASPVLNWLRRKGVPPWLAVTVVLLVFVILSLLFVAITAAGVSQLDDKLPVYKENLSNMMDNVTAVNRCSPMLRGRPEVTSRCWTSWTSS